MCDLLYASLYAEITLRYAFFVTYENPLILPFSLSNILFIAV